MTMSGYMENIDQLWIRACKSINPEKRLFSLYRRFYLNNKDRKFYIMGLLATICDKYVKISYADVIDDLNPINRWKFGLDRESDYFDICIAMMISRVRLTPANDFPGLTPPARFRQRN